MRDLNASSKVPTRFDVRIRIPAKLAQDIDKKARIYHHNTQEHEERPRQGHCVGGQLMCVVQERRLLRPGEQLR